MRFGSRPRRRSRFQLPKSRSDLSELRLSKLPNVHIVPFMWFNVRELAPRIGATIIGVPMIPPLVFVFVFFHPFMTLYVAMLKGGSEVTLVKSLKFFLSTTFCSFKFPTFGELPQPFDRNNCSAHQSPTTRRRLISLIPQQTMSGESEPFSDDGRNDTQSNASQGPERPSAEALSLSSQYANRLVTAKRNYLDMLNQLMLSVGQGQAMSDEDGVRFENLLAGVTQEVRSLAQLEAAMEQQHSMWVHCADEFARCDADGFE